MKKSLRTTLIWLAVFIALVAWYQIYEKRVKPQQTEAEEKTKQFVSLGKDEITELEIERLKNPPADDAAPGTPPTSNEYDKVKLKLVGKDWQLAEPVQDQADAATVTSMISTLVSTKQERVVDEAPKEIEQFGLKTPLIVVKASKTGGTPQVVKVGSNTPTGFSSYIQTGDGPKIYRATRSLRSTFDKDVKALRSKTVVGWPRTDVGEVEIQNPKENFVLKKENPDKEEWALAREHIPADTTEWNKTLNAVLELKATDFAAEDDKSLAKFGLGKPHVRIQLTKAKANDKLTVLIGKAGGKVYAKRGDKPTVYEVDKEIVTKLEAPSASYRSLRLANFNRFDVKRIKLERPSGVVELLKEDKDWSLPTNLNAKIDTPKVDTFLTSLQDIKLTRYLAAGAPGPKNPPLTIRLFEKKDKEEKEKLSLELGVPQGKLVTTKRSDLDVAFVISEEDLKKLNLQERDFLKVEEKKETPKETEKKG